MERKVLGEQIMDFIVAFIKSIFISIPIMFVWVAIKIKWAEWRERE